MSQNSNPNVALPPIATILINHEFINKDEAALFMESAIKEKRSYMVEVISKKNINDKVLAKTLSKEFMIPYVDINAFPIKDDLLKKFDSKEFKESNFFPLWLFKNKIVIAVVDPTDTELQQRIKFKTQLSIELVVVEYSELIKKIESANNNSSKFEIPDDLPSEFGVETVEKEQPAEEDNSDVEEAPLVKFLNNVLLSAISKGASDIHFEPYEKYYRIRFRIDGVLQETGMNLPLSNKDKLSSRVKVISKMNIAEKRIPQDGRMRLKVNHLNKDIDFRVSTLPTLFGEKIVMRILDPSSATLGIEKLGYEPEQQNALLDAVKRPYGMVLVTGPTGSGKTVSLYTCLNILNDASINISTAEDPAEINLPGINQVNVDDKSGLTFAAALKSFLRQDPDVIMVGEIRDIETAEISIKAAQTGHLVLSTLHTNDAPTTLTRLMNMGIAPFNIASSVILITAQRLARRLCGCKKSIDIPKETLLSSGFIESDFKNPVTIYGPNGCDKCGGSGYKGRVGIYQVMPISDDIRRIILTGGNAMDIAEQAKKDGVNDLRRSGILKVLQGATSLEEVLAVTNE